MRLKFMFGWVVILLCFLSTPHASAGLVAHYGLDNGVSDAVGTNHGTNDGASPVQDRFGAPDAAYSFDGGDSIVMSGSSTQIRNSPVSVSFWFSSTSTSEAANLVEVGESVRNETTPQVGYGIMLENGCIRLQFNRNQILPFDYGLWDCRRTTHLFNDGAWHHVVAVFPADGTTRVYLYVDGSLAPLESLDGQAQVAITTAYTSSLSALGAFTTYSGSKLDGKLDDVRFFNHVLSLAEVQALYTASGIIIGSFDLTGQVTFSGIPLAAEYNIEWANAPTGLWHTGTPGVTGIVARGSGLQVATVGVAQASCFYRVVVSVTNEPPPGITVTFDPVSGTAEYYEAEYTPGEPFGSLPMAYHYDSSYTFYGWRDDSWNHYNEWSTVPDGPLTLYAQYDYNPQYYTIYVGSTPHNIRAGTEYGMFLPPLPEGPTGWYSMNFGFIGFGYGYYVMGPDVVTGYWQ